MHHCGAVLEPVVSISALPENHPPLTLQSMAHLLSAQEPFCLQATGADAAKEVAVPSAIVAYKLFPQVQDVLRRDPDEGSLIGMLAIGGKEIGYFRLRHARS